jgi:class 3 adenylate cyclase/tetratricopeptide (TPR) repeat protein
MIVCPACGTENPDGFKFCGQCAAPLAAPSPIAEERKVVTTLFCDLVGSTAMGEDADPEDVDALLRRYNSLARQVVEGYGGTVEKFIGDAVVAVFGVPVVHEDDPERAVRAGLKLLEAIEELPPVAGHPVQVRVGINTGEALVRFDVTPGSGEGFLTGDAVNVGARLQSAAPPMGVVVGAATHELTRKAIVYEELEPVAAKGKREPLAVWLAKEPLARTGARALEGATPFVGRAVELSYLTALLDKATDASSPQIALIVGEPGIGKSRLIAELYAHAGAGERLVTWRQGGCLPYGEGVTFWALAEVVKAHAGILDTDDGETVATKLEDILPEGEDRPWFRQRLRALLGLEAAQAEREENFTAWLRFLEEIAARGPTVLVVEDLHWGDDALLAFVEYFAGNVTDVPLMLVATARPELFERQPAFGATGRINRVVLEPLSDGETETLVASLLDEIGAEVRQTIARQSEGNPFYAEESARLVRDTVGAAKRTEAAPAGAAGRDKGRGPLAGSIQAIIAARLDALQPDLKALLTDASVVGETFWDGALAAVGDRAAHEVDEALRELIARQLVHRVRTSSMAGEREFAFGHALARDVAYGELPRAVRARKHAAVADWIEQKAGDRVEDLAEILAHHYATALELANAAGEAGLADSALPSAVRFLTLAGDRAWPLDVAAAERQYARGLEIAGPDSPRRSTLLVKWAQAATELGREAEAVEPLEEAIVRLRAEGETRPAAVAQMALAWALPDEGETRWLELAEEALALLEADDPSPELVAALTEWLKLTFASGDARRGLNVAERAMALSEQLGLPADARLLTYRGCARIDLGDAGGHDDLLQALEMCTTSKLGEHVSLVYGLVGNWLYMHEGFRASLRVCLDGVEYARRRGSIGAEAVNRTMIVMWSEATGDWDRVLDVAVAMDALPEGARLSSVKSSSWDLIAECVTRTLVLVDRGRAQEATKLVEWLEEVHGASDRSTTDAGVCIAAGAARLALGDAASVPGLLTGSEAGLRVQGGFWWAHLLPRAVRTSLAAGDSALATRLAASLEPPLQPLAEHATIAARALVDEARGDFEAAAAGFADAASRWHDFAAVYEEAHTLLGQGRCLVALGRAPEAAPVLEQAREIFERLGAKPALGETDALLAQAGGGA